MTLPCKECLVMTQCRARLHSSGFFNGPKNIYYNTYGIVGMANREQCRKLHEYLEYIDKPKFNRGMMRQARDFFNLS